jgi:predicted dehydrogenase
VRVGVIGAGGLGQHHVRILRDMLGPDFMGFHEARTDRAEQVARDLGVTAHATLESLLDVVDAVTIVVPTPAHYDVAKLVLSRGIHAMIEKPLATTLAEADEMLALAAEKGVVVQTGHVERFNRAIRAALPYVDNPRFIQSDRLATFNPRGSDVAVVLDLMIHDIDLVHSLIQGNVADVQALGSSVLTSSVDIANARLTFDNGAVANLNVSRISRDRTRTIRIFQPGGYLSLDLAAGSGALFRMRKGLDLAALAMAPLALEQFVESVPLEAEEGEPLRLEFESFLAAVRGQAPVAVTGEEGRDALAVALQIVQDIERSAPALARRPDVGSRA